MLAATAAGSTRADSQAAALPARKFNYGLSDVVFYDDNVYRLPTGGSGASTRHDYINRASLNLQLTRPWSRQAYALDLNLYQDRYRYNDGLNNVAGHGFLTWNGQIGERLSTSLEGRYSRFLSSFANSGFHRRDMLGVTAWSGALLYQIGPGWSLDLGSAGNRISHDPSARRDDAADSRSASAALLYRTTSANSVSWSYQHLRDVFGAPAAGGSPFGRTFEQDAYALSFQYAFSALAKLQAQAGYLVRAYVGAPARAFGGEVWRTSAVWQARPNLQVTLAGWRNLQAFLEAGSNYFVARGESAVIDFLPRPGLEVSLTASRERQNYLGKEALNPGVLRRDVLTTARARVACTVAAVQLTGVYHFEKRSSNQLGFDYAANIFEIGFQLKL